MEIDPILLTILGVAAGVLILTGWVDQIYKGYKSKSLKDVSSFLLIFIIKVGQSRNEWVRWANFYPEVLSRSMMTSFVLSA